MLFIEMKKIISHVTSFEKNLSAYNDAIKDYPGIQHKFRLIREEHCMPT